MQKNRLAEPGDSGPHQRNIIRTIDTGFNEGLQGRAAASLSFPPFRGPLSVFRSDETFQPVIRNPDEAKRAVGPRRVLGAGHRRRETARRPGQARRVNQAAQTHHRGISAGLRAGFAVRRKMIQISRHTALDGDIEDEGEFISRHDQRKGTDLGGRRFAHQPRDPQCRPARGL